MGRDPGPAGAEIRAGACQGGRDPVAAENCHMLKPGLHLIFWKSGRTIRGGCRKLSPASCPEVTCSVTACQRPGSPSRTDSLGVLIVLVSLDSFYQAGNLRPLSAEARRKRAENRRPEGLARPLHMLSAQPSNQRNYKCFVKASPSSSS